MQWVKDRIGNIKLILSNITHYIFPYRCISCSEFVQEESNICSKCFKKLNFITAPYCNICGTPFEFVMEWVNICNKCTAAGAPKYEMSRSLFKFDEHSRHLIYGFKYNDKTMHAKMFAKLLFARYQSELDNVNIIVPVPMNRWKRLFRSYNPAQILAQDMARIMNRPMIPDMLIKQKWTIAQTGLNKKERSKNLQQSIKFREKYSIKNKIILLVDDVKTTGATSNLCSMILKKAGAKSVKLVTISLT